MPLIAFLEPVFRDSEDSWAAATLARWLPGILHITVPVLSGIIGISSTSSPEALRAVTQKRRAAPQPIPAHLMARHVPNVNAPAEHSW